MRDLARVIALGLLFLGACGGPPPSTTTTPTIPPTRVTSDSSASTLVPPNLGTLRQDDISIVLQQESVRVTLIPLDESVIRTLAPDSYRTLHAIIEGKRQQIIQRSQIHNVRDPRVWYVRFYGLAPNARFVPTDITVTSGGRDFRPFDVIAITPGFGTQRLQPRETQGGLLLFEDGIDVSQPLVVAMGPERNMDWSNDATTAAILNKLDAERSSIRARAGSGTRPQR